MKIHSFGLPSKTALAALSVSACLGLPARSQSNQATSRSPVATPKMPTDAIPKPSAASVKPPQPSMDSGGGKSAPPVPTLEALKLPPLAPLFDHPIRDTSICVGHDGAYYLTGTTGAPDWWGVTGDLQVWRSPDLKTWSPVVQRPRTRTVVWNIDREGTWEKRIPIRDGAPFRPLWAPEIHFLKGTYWLTYSIPFGVGGGLLKSTTGKPEGPYLSMSPDKPLVDAIDLALFEDDDGKVYLIYGGGNIRQLNEQMNGFVGEAHKFKPAGADRIGFEGTFVFKANGKYHITGAEFVNNPDGRSHDYHCYAAVSDSLFGPYSARYLAIPHAGHNSFFKDQTGKWWATFFGNSVNAPFKERAAILPIEFAPDGRFRPVLPKIAAP